jgi:hypothetical protein
MSALQTLFSNIISNHIKFFAGWVKPGMYNRGIYIKTPSTITTLGGHVFHKQMPESILNNQGACPASAN